MNTRKPAPGVSRRHRVPDEGLARLEKQLRSGIQIGRPVLAQWIRRYGDAAREVIRAHDQYHAEFDLIE